MSVPFIIIEAFIAVFLLGIVIGMIIERGLVTGRWSIWP